MTSANLLTINNASKKIVCVFESMFDCHKEIMDRVASSQDELSGWCYGKCAYLITG
jgi:hypothetical protein